MLAATSTEGGLVFAALHALVIALYVQIDGFLEAHRGPGRPPKLSDSELTTLAVAQVLPGVPNDRQLLALARAAGASVPAADRSVRL